MKRTFFVITVLLVMIGFLFINAKESAIGYVVGDEATDFSLPNIDGSNVSLADYPTAKGFIVVFTCNTCPYAKAYEDRIIELDKQYRAKGFPVIAINPNNVAKSPGDSMKEMKDRAVNKEYPFPYLRDDEQTITMKYGATKTPHVYVLNKNDDKLVVSYIGAIDDSPRDEAEVEKRYVEDAINALLSGEQPSVTNKKAIGCTIKWRS